MRFNTPFTQYENLRIAVSNPLRHVPLEALEPVAILVENPDPVVTP